MASKYAPVISATGITAPDFATNHANLTADYQSIFGADVYLGNDSQDGQWLAVLAQIFTDLGAAAVAVYNSFSPATAQGAGLSSNVKLNGLSRLVPSASTMPVTIGGIVGTTINNGLVADVNGNLWALPASVVVPSSGTITVTATCTVQGAISAAANSVSINTPVYGWQTVSNGTATPGSAVETDAALRVRQAASVALPSVTIFEGIVAAIENLTGVTRARGYENNTNTTNALGIAANSLAFLVEGGAQSDIINAIFEKITPGIPTIGNISQTVTDSNGSTRVINYAQPTNATITVAITVHGLAGWSTTTEAIIAAALVAYINALPIGQNVSYTGMFLPAYLGGTPYAGTFNITALTLKKNSGSAAAADVTLAYNEAPLTSIGNITFVVV